MNGKRFIFSLLVSLLIVASAVPAFAVLADRVLVLPPAVTNPDFDTELLWRKILYAYSEGVQGVELIKPDEVVRAMGGDTLIIDLPAMDEAIDWGQKLDADAVVQIETQGSTLFIQRVDPWTTELTGPVSSDEPLSGIRRLESNRWVYGRGVLPDPAGYETPNMQNPGAQVTAWLHENQAYPPDALMALKEGMATVHVTVSPEGVPVEVRLLSADPTGMDFEEAIVKALWSLRYQPAALNGEPVYGVWKGTFTVSPTM